MSEPSLRTTRHTTIVAACPDAVFRLIADPAGWPRILGPVIATERLSGDAERDRLRVWELAQGEIRAWTTCRELDVAGRTAHFRHETPDEPVAAMGGRWQVTPYEGGARIVLCHDYRVLDDHPADAEWLTDVIDRNSVSYLTGLRTAAELGDTLSGLTRSFQDSVVIDACPADVYDFLARAQDWPGRLPHVRGLELVEDDADLQYLVVRSQKSDGTAHTSALARVCLPGAAIVYKQTRPEPVLRSHVGRWTIAPAPGGVRVTSAHTITLDPDVVRRTGSTADDAAGRIGDELRRESELTLAQAARFAQARPRPRAA